MPLTAFQEATADGAGRGRRIARAVAAKQDPAIAALQQQAADANHAATAAGHKAERTGAAEDVAAWDIAITKAMRLEDELITLVEQHYRRTR